MEPIDVKIARIRAGVKQREIAEILGVSPKLVGHWETGRRKLKPETLNKILYLLEARNATKKDTAS